MNAVGYVRVSTGQQEQSGLGLAAQEAAILSAVSQRRWELIETCQDVASGKSTNGRPGLERCLEMLSGGDAGALVVARLDRLARSVIDGAEIIRRSQREHWTIVVCDLGLDTSTPMGMFGAHILLAAAELERGMVSERTRTALEVARARGVQLGRKTGDYQFPADVRERIVSLRSDGRSLRSIARDLTEDGVPTTKPGRPWSAESVRQVVLQDLRDR